MEINITWNVCRICLQEQNTSVCASTEISTDMATQISDMTGIMIKSNDSLPQKICKKCLQVLKQAVNFCTTCRNSDAYLQNILEKAKSATSLFQMDKPNKGVFDDIIEEPETEDIFGEERLSEEYESGIKDKTESVDYTLLEPQLKKKKEERMEHTTTISNETEKNTLDLDLESDKESAIIAVTTENNLLAKPPEEALSKTNMDFGSIFLNNESDIDELNDTPNAAANVNFSKCVQEHEHENVVADHIGNSNFLQYKTLEEVTLDSVDEDVQDEILQSSSLSPVDITSNDGNDELFFIFSDEVIPKPEESEISSNHTKDDDILVEMTDMVDNMVNSDSESNTFDQSDCIDEEFTNSDDARIRLFNADLVERAIVKYKPLCIQQKIDACEGNEDDCYVIKSAQPKTTTYFCNFCGNQFNSRNSLKHHMRIHRNERNYECELCGKRFTAACNLTTHMRTHTGEKPFVCQYCQRRFSDKSTHVKHERSHTDERPYSCTVCQKAFTLSSSLKAHKKVHTGEKPFSCFTCIKSFKLPHQLKAHMSTNAHKIRTEEEFITPN